MKKLNITNPIYKTYEKRFKKWLEIIGMSKITQYYMPIHVREMLYYMEDRGINKIESINPKVLRDYFQNLSHRKNQRRGGGLSKSYLNKHLQAIKKFSEYLWRQYKIQLPVTLKMQAQSDVRKIEILTPLEVKSLYEATEIDKELTLRDKAILDVFYSCGLRRSEGVMLDISDIDLSLRRLHVRYGKNYTQRYVPFTRAVAERFRTYLEQSRNDLIKNKENKAFVISLKGRRMAGISIIVRIKKLQQRSNQDTIQNKNIGLHTLRHSIATHLLHKGLPLSQIAAFFGHKSIESTQIYTRLVHEL